MLLQAAQREVELGLLLLVVAFLGLVSYWVYRDAEARGMDDAAYWGTAVGVAFVVGVIVGGLLAVGVYLSTRPDEYEGGQQPFGSISLDDEPDPDPAHADLPPVPELTASRVEKASVTALRGYARRYDHLDATADPARLRTALRELVESGETDRLGPTTEEAATAPGTSGDPRRHVGRPELRGTGTNDEVSNPGGEERDDEASNTGGEERDEENDDDREFEWVEE